MTRLEDYIPITGQAAIDDLHLLARHLTGKTIQNINSTAVGGGVAEILSRVVPLMKQCGLDVRWDVIKGDERFFTVTKKIHNGLHGVDVALSDDDRDYFLAVNRENAGSFSYADIVVVHDPQPVGLVEQRGPSGGRWAWRCHIDFSRPDQRIWNILEQYVRQYDTAIFS